MITTEIDRHEPLFPGDKIRMYFKAFGPNWKYLRASELALLIYQLEQENPDYQLLGWQAMETELILDFRIKEPIEPTTEVQQAAIGTAAVIAVIVIGAGLFTWLSLTKVEKIIDSPAGKVALAGTGSVGIAVLVISVLLLLRYFSE